MGRDTRPLEFTVFDIGQHAYVKPCLSYIQSRFPHSHFEYIEGDSTVTMPAWIERNAAVVGTYDVVHVDGGHSEHCVTSDMRNADRLVKLGGILIVDDTNHPPIARCADAFVASNAYEDLPVLKTEGYPHRVLRKVRGL